MDLLKPSINFQEVRDGRRSPLFYFDVDLTTARSVAAGTALILEVSGDSFYVDKNPLLVGAATVHFQDTTFGRTPAPVYCEPGFITKVPFTRLLIENDAQAGKIFRVHYGLDLDFQPGASSSVNVNGSVSVIDGGKARTLAGVAFLGSVTNPGAAATYTHLQLWNPAASGKNCILEQIQINCAVAQAVSLRSHNAALTTLYGASPSKKLGGAASTMELRSQTSAAYIPATADLMAFNCPATSSTPFKFTEPVVIAPGQGLVLFVNNVQNSNLATSFEFLEETA